jgi:UTP-glucose-1-phosphate uridylyltransferase
LRQIMDEYEKTPPSIIWVQRIAEDQIPGYGIIDLIFKAGRLH